MEWVKRRRVVKRRRAQMEMVDWVLERRDFNGEGEVSSLLVVVVEDLFCWNKTRRCCCCFVLCLEIGDGDE